MLVADLLFKGEWEGWLMDVTATVISCLQFFFLFYLFICLFIYLLVCFAWKKCEYVMIGVKLSSQPKCRKNFFNVAIFLDIVSMISVKLCSGSAYCALPVHSVFSDFE